MKDRAGYIVPIWLIAAGIGIIAASYAWLPTWQMPWLIPIMAGSVLVAAGIVIAVDRCMMSEYSWAPDYRTLLLVPMLYFASVTAGVAFALFIGVSPHHSALLIGVTSALIFTAIAVTKDN